MSEMMEFQEVDRRYSELRRGYDVGAVSTEEMEAGLKEMMVQDASGRWWAKSGDSGQWRYHDGARWVPGAPPVGQVRVGEQDDGNSAGTLIFIGLACAVLAVILSFWIWLTWLFLAIPGMRLGYKAMQEGSRVGGAVTIAACVLAAIIALVSDLVFLGL